MEWGLAKVDEVEMVVWEISNSNDLIVTRNEDVDHIQELNMQERSLLEMV